MRVVEEPTEVTVANGRPQSFSWSGQSFKISEILHTWIAQQKGFRPFRKPAKRRFYRVHAQGFRNRVTAELCVPENGDESGWMVAAVYD